jgi:hypothetical protein
MGRPQTALPAVGAPVRRLDADGLRPEAVAPSNTVESARRGPPSGSADVPVAAPLASVPARPAATSSSTAAVTRVVATSDRGGAFLVRRTLTLRAPGSTAFMRPSVLGFDGAVGAAAVLVKQDFVCGLAGRYLAQAAADGDTALVTWGRAELLLDAGMASPSWHLWSLPTRTLDADLTELVRVMRGPDPPTWGGAMERSRVLEARPGRPARRCGRARSDAATPRASASRAGPPAVRRRHRTSTMSPVPALVTTRTDPSKDT